MQNPEIGVQPVKFPIRTDNTKVSGINTQPEPDPF
jgi:hypothetical protein